MSIIQLPYGAILLKNIIDENQQIEIIDSIIKLHTLNAMPNQINSAKYAPNALFTYNAGNGMSAYCKGVQNNNYIKNDIDLLLNLGEQIAQIINDVKKDDPYKNTPYKFKLDENIERNNADALYCIAYTKNSSCYRHTDLWNSWVMGISFGASCDFAYGLNKTAADENMQVRINESDYDTLNENIIKFTKKLKKGSDIITKVSSGDIIIFNGNLMYHSVPHIYDDCPNYISNVIETNPNFTGKQIERINIQYRDSRTMNSTLHAPNVSLLYANNIENLNISMKSSIHQSN